MRRALLALLAATLRRRRVRRSSAAPAIDVSATAWRTAASWFASPVTLRWSVTNGTRSAGCVDETIADEGTDVARSCQARGRRPHEHLGGAPEDRPHAARPSPPSSPTGRPIRRLVHAPVCRSPSQGQDATSGLAGCDQPAAMADPTTRPRRSPATCRDVAGNTATRAFPFQYDATPPDLGALAAETGDRLVQLSWPAAATARVERTPGLGGAGHSSLRAQPDGLNDLRVRNDVRYRYAVTVADQAGNTTTREITAVPGPRLLAPAPRAQLTGAPMLRWTPVRGARYYNVQLFRKGHKVLSALAAPRALPARAALALQGRQAEARRRRLPLAGLARGGRRAPTAGTASGSARGASRSTGSPRQQGMRPLPPVSGGCDRHDPAGRAPAEGGTMNAGRKPGRRRRTAAARRHRARRRRGRRDERAGERGDHRDVQRRRADRDRRQPRQHDRGQPQRGRDRSSSTAARSPSPAARRRSPTPR